MTVEIRPARFDELPACVALGASFVETTRYPTLFGAFSEAALAGVLEVLYPLETTAILVAALPDRLVGGIVVLELVHALTLLRYAEELCWWVEPGYVRFGAGPQLLQAAEGWARARGCAGIKMIAPIPSRVGRYYERRGYLPIETAFYKPLELEP